MGENYRFYFKKMAELRAARMASWPLRSQLVDLLGFVQECEARWERESRWSAAR